MQQAKNLSEFQKKRILDFNSRDVKVRNANFVVSDSQLYEKAKEILLRTLSTQPPQFWEDLKYFKNEQEKLYKFCSNFAKTE